MIQIGKFLTSLLLATLFFSCGNVDSSEVIGDYVGFNYLNTIDSIQLSSDGKYYRKIVSTENNKLIFENEGSWELKNSEIFFTKYLVNNDELYIKYKYDERFLSTALFEVKNHFGEIRIIENHDKNLFFKKINKPRSRTVCRE